MSYIQHHPSIIETGENADLDIQDGVVIRPFASILCKEQIIIGKGTQIASGVQIVDHDHDINGPLEEIAGIGKKERITIGSYCWIGANAVILRGVNLGDGCVVGAGAVVIKGNYPKGSILVGVPATIKQTRNL